VWTSFILIDKQVQIASSGDNLNSAFLEASGQAGNRVANIVLEARQQNAVSSRTPSSP
jgi:hypothetical protein